MMSLKLVETHRQLFGSRNDTADTCRNVALNSLNASTIVGEL